MMIQLEFEQTLMDEKRFIDDLIRASIFDIGKTEEISKFIEDGVFPSEYGINKVYDNGMSFFLIVAMTHASLRIQIGHVGAKNYTMLELAITIQIYLVTCIKTIQQTSFTEKFHNYAYGNILELKRSIPLFHPYRHVTTTNTKMTSTVIQSNGTLLQYKLNA